MKSCILASMLALTPTQSAETHLLGNLDLPVPVAEVTVQETELRYAPNGTAVPVIVSPSDFVGPPARANIAVQAVQESVFLEPARSCKPKMRKSRLIGKQRLSR